MGSLGAMQQGAADRYFQEVTDNQHRQTGARRHRGSRALQGLGGRDHLPADRAVCAPAWAMCGCASIEAHAQRGRSSSKSPRRVSARSHVHDVQITKEAPNYRVD
jgi:IMP dehydrogenase